MAYAALLTSPLTSVRNLVPSAQLGGRQHRTAAGVCGWPVGDTCQGAGSALVVSPPPPRWPASGKRLVAAERGLVASYHAGATAVIASGVGAVGHAAKGDDAGSAPREAGRQPAAGRVIDNPIRLSHARTPACLTYSRAARCCLAAGRCLAAGGGWAWPFLPLLRCPSPPPQS
eukprot:COSAG01_NODE_372_length_17995_cov_16.957812_9_plen_173_part_00